MSRSAFFSTLVPLALLFLSFWRAGVGDRYVEAKRLQHRSQVAQSRLDELRAISVASKIDEKKHRDLVAEFSSLTDLPLGRESSVSKGEVSAQVARFIDAVADELRAEPFARGQRGNLHFLGVTPGQRQDLSPFLSVDFELNLEGRFFAVPEFLALLSEIAQKQSCAISTGELTVRPSSSFGANGELSITLPLRAYFLER